MALRVGENLIKKFILFICFYYTEKGTEELFAALVWLVVFEPRARCFSHFITGGSKVFRPFYKVAMESI